MKIQIYHPKQIVSVRVEDFTQNKDIEYRQGKKSFWSSNKKSGFFFKDSFIDSSCWTPEELESGKLYEVKFKIRDNKVFFKPYVQTYYTDGSSSNHQFEDYESAKNFALEITKSIRNRIITENK